MNRTTKRWVIGGSAGALAIGLGYVLLHRRHSDRELPGYAPQDHKHKHHHGGDVENDRGEYGHHHHHHHRGHDHG